MNLFEKLVVCWHKCRSQRIEKKIRRIDGRIKETDLIYKKTTDLFSRQNLRKHLTDIIRKREYLEKKIHVII
jgi:hypothetical protein